MTSLQRALIGQNADAAVPDEQRLALRSALRRTLTLVDTSPLAAAISDEDRARAQRTAEMLFEACGGGSIASVRLAFVAELLAPIALELAADRPQARRLIVRLRADGGLAPAALGRELLRNRPVLSRESDLLEVILGLVLVFAGGDAISLLTPGDDGRLTIACRIGEADLTAASSRFEVSAAAVVQIDGVAGEDGIARLLVAAAAPALDRHRSAGEANSDSAVERRLARVRFDLHDGPQQDIHLLAQDLRLFRDQLRPMIAGHTDEARAAGRLDDLEAQLVALDGDLRLLATTFQSPFRAPESLPDGLRQLTEAFARRTGVIPQTRLHGSLTRLTDSQQIALLSLIREALSNIRKHSDGDHVEIAIASGVDGVRLEITDDGSGFDPAPTRVRAAQAGRLGLVGMHERVRMLGGTIRIDSRPGGPTVISATLPPWSRD